jgi:hypothetical protein
MKLIYAVVLVFLVNATNAQQPFQGTIVYNLHTDKEKNDAELTVRLSEFSIPGDYKKFDASDWISRDPTATDPIATMADTSVMYTNTTAIAPRKKLQVKSKTKPTAPKKTTTKGEAIRPRKPNGNS